MTEPVDFQTEIGSRTDPANDPTEARLVIHTNKIKTNILIKTLKGEMARKHPPAVATPFPPFLNLK